MFPLERFQLRGAQARGFVQFPASSSLVHHIPTGLAAGFGQSGQPHTSPFCAGATPVFGGHTHTLPLCSSGLMCGTGGICTRKATMQHEYPGYLPVCLRWLSVQEEFMGGVHQGTELAGTRIPLVLQWLMPKTRLG